MDIQVREQVRLLQKEIKALQRKINYLITTETSQGVSVDNAVDTTDVVNQFNALLASLRTAGVIAT